MAAGAGLGPGQCRQSVTAVLRGPRSAGAGRGQPGPAAAPAARGSRPACPLGQGALPGLGAPTAAGLCGQADKRLVPAVVLAAAAAAGDRRGAARRGCRGRHRGAGVPGYIILT